MGAAMINTALSSYELAPNLKGRIRNLALSPTQINSLYPLLEAIMNSIQAIQDRFGEENLSRGVINIIIERDVGSINVSVVDNGIGLNDNKFEAFITPDTDHRLRKGGKGVGRLIWLKTFASVEIESVYSFKGRNQKRSFTFRNVEKKTISNHVVEKVLNKRELGTKVSLINMYDGYRQLFPSKAKTVASHIIRHFLPIFITSKHPRITLKDGEDHIDVAKELSSNIVKRSKSDVKIKSSDNKVIKLKVVHMRVLSKYAPKSTPNDMMREGKPHNAVYYAADQRVAFEYALDNQLGITTFDECKYVGVLEGEFLNKHMNQERTHLNLPFEDEKNIRDSVFESVTGFLAPYMKRVKESQVEEFKNISNDFPSLAAAAPENYIDTLPYSMIRKEDILADLAKRKNRALQSTKIEASKFEEKVDELLASTGGISIDQEKELISIVDVLRMRLTRETNSSLAEYMVRRRAVIDLLDKYMGVSSNGKLFKEDMIHTLICPMRVIDNKRKLLDHNLWLLDDRFAFYSFLASDKPLSSFTQCSDAGRPDLLFILDQDLAFRHTDQRDTPVFLVEFKRPSKNSYRTNSDRDWDAEDPFDRFYSYIQTLRVGFDGDQTFDGRFLKIDASRPFHCFLVADMTPALQKKCVSRLSQIEGATSFSGYVPKVGFVNAISYDDLIHNAKLRHEVFFKHLGIHDS
jgi:hypothetical protein